MWSLTGFILLILSYIFAQNLTKNGGLLLAASGLSGIYYAIIIPLGIISFLICIILQKMSSHKKENQELYKKNNSDDQ